MVPRHIAIIPDGNRRWAKAQGLPSFSGHSEGHEVMKKVVDQLFAAGVEYVTVFGFSKENWQRSEAEVTFLMNLFHKALTEELDRYLDRGVRVRVLGDREGLSDRLQAAIVSAEERTASGAKGQFNLCLNYGGRAEIVAAVQKLVREGVPASEITEATLAGAMWSAGIPDPDVILRTSGEQRMSGFLTWSGTYSEYFFAQKNWPELTSQDVERLLADFEARERRFGK